MICGRLRARPLGFETTLALGVAGLALGTVAIWMVLGRGGDAGVACAAGVGAAALSATVVAHLGLRESVGSAPVMILLSSLVAGTANSGLGFVIHILSRGVPGSLYQPFGGAVLATVVGAPIALPLGVVFGTLYLVPLMICRGTRRAPTHCGVDEARLAIGCWLVAIGVATGLAAAATNAPAAVLSTPAIASAAGVILVSFAATQALRREAWLKRVANGAVPAWRIREPDDLQVPHDLPRHSGAAQGAVLCRMHVFGPDVFRSTPTPEPWSWLPARFHPRLR